MLSMKSTRRCLLFVLFLTLAVLLHAQVVSPKKDPDRPPVQGSTVGYIDDAVVESQVRVRFDSVIGDSQVDMAELFFAEDGYNDPAAAGLKPGLASDLTFQQLYMRGEYAPKKFLSFLVDVPVRFIQPQSFAPNTTPNGGFGDHGGLSDVSVGMKWAALARTREYVTFQLVGTFPTGDAGKGLGTSHYTVAPELLYYQKLTDRLTVESQFGDSHPIGGDGLGFAGDVVEYGVGPSFVAFKSDKVQFAPVVELVIWRVLGGNWSDPTNLPDTPVESADASNIMNLKFGARATLGENNSFYVGYGRKLTTDNFWYTQILRVEYRRSF
jgi:hypothetical protein